MLVSPSRNLTFQLVRENSITFWQADGLNKLGLDSTTLAILLQLNQSCRTEKQKIQEEESDCSLSLMGLAVMGLRYKFNYPVSLS